ncbi:DUF6161 domain-containing protein [Bradyrhizobium sp.]
MDLTPLANSASTEPLKIARLLSHRTEVFQTGERGAAESLKEAQAQFWRTLLGALSQRYRNSANQRVFGTLAQDITSMATFELVDVTKDKNTVDLDEGGNNLNEHIELVASIPILTRDSLSSLVQFVNDNPVMVAAAILVECRTVTAAFNVSDITLSLLSAMLVYSSGGAITSDIAARVWGFQGEVERARTQAEETSKLIRAEFGEFKASEAEKLTAFKRSLSEEVKLRSASTLWSDRAFWHRLVSTFALAAFVTIIVAALWSIASNFKPIIDLLPRDKDNHIEYVSIALIAIPAVGVGWALKVLARFIQNNSILGDDSRQRQAMTRTYLALVADKDSGVTEKDRLVMLNAIFRPLPGIQSDEVAPPTILDLLKKE